MVYDRLHCRKQVPRAVRWDSVPRNIMVILSCKYMHVCSSCRMYAAAVAMTRCNDSACKDSPVG